MGRKLITDITPLQRAGARAWYKMGREIVDAKLRQSDSTQLSYPPTGLCATNPEFWTAAHWRWFLETENTNE